MNAIKAEPVEIKTSPCSQKTTQNASGNITVILSLKHFGIQNQ